jgi:hypothetical protein
MSFFLSLSPFLLDGLKTYLSLSFLALIVCLYLSLSLSIYLSIYLCLSLSLSLSLSLVLLYKGADRQTEKTAGNTEKDSDRWRKEKN